MYAYNGYAKDIVKESFRSETEPPIEFSEETASTAGVLVSSPDSEFDDDEEYCKQPVHVSSQSEDGVEEKRSPPKSNAAGHTFSSSAAPLNTIEVPSVFTQPMAGMGTEMDSSTYYLNKLQERRQELTLQLRTMAQRNYEDDHLILNLMYGGAPAYTTAPTPESLENASNTAAKRQAVRQRRSTYSARRRTILDELDLIADELQNALLLGHALGSIIGVTQLHNNTVTANDNH